MRPWSTMRTFGRLQHAPAQRPLEERPAQQQTLEPAREPRLVVPCWNQRMFPMTSPGTAPASSSSRSIAGKSVFSPRSPLASRP